MLRNEFYKAAYQFHERWTPCPKNLSEWEQASAEAAQICADHGNDKFLLDLMAAVYNDMARMKAVSS